MPHSLCEEWKGLTYMRQSLSSLQIPCFIGQIHKDSINQLLILCDASTNSYAATIYLRIVSSTSIRVNLVYSKMRLNYPTGFKKSLQIWTDTGDSAKIGTIGCCDWVTSDQFCNK